MLLVDLRAGMPAQETAHCHFHIYPCRFLLHPDRYVTVCPHASGAACQEDPLLLGINVQHPFCLQHGEIDRRGTFHTRLLIRRDHSLDTRMCNVVGVEQREDICDGDAVVTAETCSLRADKIPVHFQAKRIPLQIDITAVFLDGNHIHMPLQYDGRSLLIPRGRFLHNDHIVARIPDVEQSPVRRKPGKITADPIQISRSVRYIADVLKIVKHFLWF